MAPTALEIEFSVHYREMDQESGRWNGLRIRRLCNLLRLTQEEFARLIRLKPHQLREWIDGERWPGCVLLILELIERSAHQTYLGKVHSKPLFPNGI